MASNAPLPYAEAKVQVRTVGETEWRDSLDFDPVEIPVESTDTTDVFNEHVIKLIDAILEADVEHPTQVLDYNVVWSETGHTVKGLCPVCDDVFPIAEGAPGDELNEGYDAVFCGCDPADQDED